MISGIILDMPNHVRKDRTPAANAKTWNTDFTSHVRGRINPQVLTDWALLLLMDQGSAKIVEDSRCAGGYRATYDPRGGPGTTMEQKQWACKFITERGWGLPEATTKVEAHIEARMLTINANLGQAELGAIPYEARAAAVRLLTQSLKPALVEGKGGEKRGEEEVVDAGEREEVEDAEFSESETETEG